MDAGIIACVQLGCLIVDDNAEFLTAARELLERQGVNVLGVALTGAEATHAAQELRPEVALVDVDLGDENGVDVVRSLVAGEHSPKVILISAYPLEVLQELIADCPAVGFLAKAALSRTAIEDVLRAA